MDVSGEGASLLAGGLSPSKVGSDSSAGGGGGGSRAGASAAAPPPSAGRGGVAAGAAQGDDGVCGRVTDWLRRTLWSERLAVNGRQLRVIDKVGEGGFSFVYVAEDTTTGARYAIKRMVLQSSEATQRARREVDVQRVSSCGACCDKARGKAATAC